MYTVTLQGLFDANFYAGRLNRFLQEEKEERQIITNGYDYSSNEKQCDCDSLLLHGTNLNHDSYYLITDLSSHSSAYQFTTDL